VSGLDGDTVLLLGDFSFLSLFFVVSYHPWKVPLILNRSTWNYHVMCSYSRPVTYGGNLTYFAKHLAPRPQYAIVHWEGF